MIKRIPRAGRLCALVGLLNALAWSLLVPPFEVPDENAHYAYAQQIAERGALPHSPPASTGRLSPAEDATLASIHFYEMVGTAGNPQPLTSFEQAAIADVQRGHLSTRGSGDALSATNNPPLYYAAQAVPYHLAGSSVLNRLAVMRVLSALFAAASVLCVFMFLRELLPGAHWTWTAGALAAALQPMFAFISSGVNSDSLLYLSGAALFWMLARAFRRGLRVRTGLEVGGVLLLGLLTKLTALGFVPGVALALLLLLVRAGRTGRLPEALRGAASATGVVLLPMALYLALAGRAATPGGVGAVRGGLHPFALGEELSHIWQLYLPRLPGMRPQFSYLPLRETWFHGFIGQFGWLDYGLPEYFYSAALVVLLALLASAALELVRRRRALLERFGEFAVYAALFGGLLIEVGVESYRAYTQSGVQFEQARYVLSGLALYAALIALATRVPGRRWGPVVAVLVVGLAFAHDLFAQFVTIARYYA